MATINGIIHHIQLPELLPMTIAYKKKNCRLVQICSVKVCEGFEMSYSFAKGYDMETLRFFVKDDEQVSSISAVFASAFLYENEVKELFGVKIEQISVDYHNKLYRINVNTPFGRKEGAV